MRILGQHRVNLAPQTGFNDGRVHAGEPFPLVRNLAKKDAVAQQLVQVLLVDAFAGPGLGLCAMGGLMFACGLPGWALVRWIFNFIDKNRDASIDDITKTAKELL